MKSVIQKTLLSDHNLKHNHRLSQQQQHNLQQQQHQQQQHQQQQPNQHKIDHTPTGSQRGSPTYTDVPILSKMYMKRNTRNKALWQHILRIFHFTVLSFNKKESYLAYGILTQSRLREKQMSVYLFHKVKHYLHGINKL